MALSLCAMAWAGSPTDLDSLFRGNEYKPTLSASLRDTTSNSAVPAKVTSKNDKADGYFMLQFEAVGDFDAAQRRKAQLSASTGYTIQVVFDPPFYKLRGGGWTKRKVAEDKARELSAYNINAFVVKLRSILLKAFNAQRAGLSLLLFCIYTFLPCHPGLVPGSPLSHWRRLQHTEDLLDAVVVELEEGAFFGWHVRHLAFVVGPFGTVAKHYVFIRERIEKRSCLDEKLLV